MHVYNVLYGVPYVCKKVFTWNTRHQKLMVRVGLASEQDFRCHMFQMIPRYIIIMTFEYYHAIYLYILTFALKVSSEY